MDKESDSHIVAAENWETIQRKKPHRQEDVDMTSNSIKAFCEEDEPRKKRNGNSTTVDGQSQVKM